MLLRTSRPGVGVWLRPHRIIGMLRAVSETHLVHSLAIGGRAGVFWPSRAYDRGVGMSLSKLSAGDGYRYLMDQTVSADRLRSQGGSLEDYYVKSGCPDGVWVGQGIGDRSRPDRVPPARAGGAGR